MTSFPNAGSMITGETHSTRSDAVACRDLLRAGSKSFYAASLLLPSRFRADVCALYAFCRLADDEVDRGADPVAAVARLRSRIEALYAGGEPQGAVERAFSGLIVRRNIPLDMPMALVEGFAWDAAGRPYETLSDVRAYGVRVAGVVGMMTTLIMDVRAEEALSRACDLGVAMQLTNIARDVGEDAREGRLYLPRVWFRQEGLDPDHWMKRPCAGAAIARMTQRLLGEADRLYRRAESGIALLPLDARPAIWAARRIYADIGVQIARNGLDNVHKRAFVSKPRKVVLLGSAFMATMSGASGATSPALCEAAKFVAAAAQPDERRLQSRRPRLGARIVGTIELFHRLAEAERASCTAPQRKRMR